MAQVCWTLARAVLWLGLAGTGIAQAATYTFPGTLPAGCSASAGSYSCGALSFASSDVVVIHAPTPATINIGGALAIGNAQINAAGSAANLNLVVAGALTAGANAVVNGGVAAASVTSTSGGAVFGGSISATGQIDLGDRTLVSADVTSSSGAIFVNDRAEVGGNVSSAGAITIGARAVVGGDVTGTAGGAVTVGANASVIGSISTGGAVTVGADANVNDVTSTSGAVTVGARAAVAGDVSASGAITVGANAGVSGAVTSSTGAVTLGAKSDVSGPVSGYGAVTVGANTTVGGTVSSSTGAITLGKNSSVPSVCCGSPCTTACVSGPGATTMPPTPTTGPHHIEIRHGTGVGLTCSPATLSVVACANAACTTTYTGGISGTLSASAGASANWVGGAAVSVASGATSTTKQLQLTSLGSVTLGLSGVTPAAASATTCNFGTPACTFSAADAGFLFNVVNHAAETTQTVAVSAVRKSDSSALCVPAFASVSKAVNFACTYQNPSSGTWAARLRGVALNAANSATAACDAGGRAVTLDFDAGGIASVALQYADVGQLQLNARYTGPAGSSEAGLLMTGTDSFISAPASFEFSAVSSGPIKAGAAFAATVNARNSAAATTPNFGLESPAAAATLTFARVQPAGAAASDGVFSGSLGAFTAGVATATNLVWSDVGRGDLSVSLNGASYLGSGLTVSGNTASPATAGTGGVGRFIPHHFDVVVTPACGAFSYAGQPFTVQVTAMNGLAPPTATLNYDASLATAPNFAQAVTLGAAPALSTGTLSGSAIAASRFSAGVATVQTPVFTFANKLTAPQTLVLRAVDADGVSSLGQAEGSTVLRSGRLRVSNAFGSEKAALALAVQAQYWGGNAWVVNSADSCSALPASAVALGNYLDQRGIPTSAWSTSASAVTISGGQGTLILSAPSSQSSQSPSSTGSVDLALNLGSLTLDQSCLSTHPPSVGAGLAWLRSQNGACSTGWLRDPSARASFGIYTPEMLKSHDARDLF